MPESGRWEGLRLQGEGIVLRRWHPGDLDALLRHADDPEVPRGLSDRFPHPYTRADGEAFLAGRVVDLTMPVLVIEVDGQACGSIGVRVGQGERRHGADLGYWLGRAYWGRGLMSAVAGLYVPWAMQALALYRLQATVLAFNHASARVLEKTGFAEEGLMRAAVVKDGVAHDLRLFARIAPPLS